MKRPRLVYMDKKTMGRHMEIGLRMSDPAHNARTRRVGYLHYVHPVLMQMTIISAIEASRDRWLEWILMERNIFPRAARLTAQTNQDRDEIYQEFARAYRWAKDNMDMVEGLCAAYEHYGPVCPV